MTISSGIAGTTVLGTVIGVGAGVGAESPLRGASGSVGPAAGQLPGSGSAPQHGQSLLASTAHDLPFTGVSHLMMMISIALIMIMAGVLILGVTRRRGLHAMDGSPLP